MTPMKRLLAIIKLGGSAITNKNKFKSIREEVIKNIATVLKKYFDEGNRIVLVHGGGSFGHPVAKRWNINKGLSESNKIGLSETVDAMRELSLKISEILREHGLPIFPIQPSAFIITKNGEILIDNDLAVVKEALKNELVPMLWGDAVFDIVRGCSILSGDKIMFHLAKKLRPDVVVFGTDVEGIYVYKNGKRRLIRKITDTNFNEVYKSISSASSTDVTGGMHLKIGIMKEITKLGVKTCLVSLFDTENFYRALKGEEFIGTLFE